MVLRPDKSWRSVDGLLALGGKDCTAEIGVGGMTWCSEEVGSIRELRREFADGWPSQGHNLYALDTNNKKHAGAGATLHSARAK